MLERFLTQLVDKYLTPYADVDPDAVRNGIRGGEVVLRDVKLKSSAFSALELPLTVKRGKVGEIRIKMNLRCLRAAPASIVLNDLEVVVGPAGAMALAATRAERRKKTVTDTLKEDASTRRMRVHGIDAMALQPREQSFFHKLFGASIDSLGVELNGLQFRYEDDSSDPANPFSAGVTLDSLKFTTADVKSWNPCEWAANKQLVNKLLALKNLAVYWQPGLSEYAQPKADGKDGAFFVLSPLCAEAMISVNRGRPTQEQPRLSVEVKLQEAQYNIDCSTLRDVATVLDAAVKHSNREIVSIDRPRVSYAGNSSIWWRYVLDCVRDEVRARAAAARAPMVIASIRKARRYVPLFKRWLSAEHVNGSAVLSEEEEKEMRGLEDEMSMQMVMALRGRVEEMLVEELAADKAADTQPEGMFRRLLRGWRAGADDTKQMEVAGLVMDVTEAELCEFVGEEGEAAFDDFEGDTPDAVWYRASLSLKTFRLSLSDRSGTTGGGLAGHELAKLAFGELSCAVSGRRGPALAFTGDLSLASLDVRDLVTAGGAYESVVRGGEAGRPLVRVHAEQGPADGHAAYVLRVSTAPCTVVYSAALAARAGRFTGAWRRVDSVALTALISRSAAQRLDQQRVAGQQLLRKVLDAREPVDVELDLHAPDLLFPSSPAGARGDSVVAVRIGHVAARSTIAGMPTAPAGASDTCQIDWTGSQVVACGAAEDWRGGGGGVFSVPRVSTVVDVAAARGDTAALQFSVAQEVAEVTTALNSQTLHHVATVLLAVRWGGGGGAGEEHVELDSAHLSSVVRMAQSFVITVEQGWEYMKRREMAAARALEGDAAARLRGYADWRRARYTVSVGAATFTLTDTKGKAPRGVLRARVRGAEGSVLVRSLDAEAQCSVAGIEVEDLVEPFGPDYKYLLRTQAAAGGDAFAKGRIHVWHRASPDYAGLDADAGFEVGHVSVGGNLETLADVQNVLVEAIEEAVRGYEGLEEQRDAEREGRKVLVRNVGAAADALKAVRARPLAVTVRGATEGADLRMYTGRGGAVYPVASVEVEACSLSNTTTRARRVEVKGSVADVLVQDLTPTGTRYADVMRKAGGTEGALLEFEFVHYGAGEAAEGRQGALSVRVARVEGALCPRFLAEAYYYVSESSVYRTNVVAVRHAAAGAVKFRHRHAEALRSRYAMGFALAAGGCALKVPAGSNDDDHFLLEVPPVEAANAFDASDAARPVERMSALLEGARVATVIGGVQQDLISVSMRLELSRQLAAGGLGPEVPLLKASWSVGTVSVTMAQEQVSLAWRTATQNLREARATMSWVGDRRARMRDRSLLDIGVINDGLRHVIEEVTAAEEQRQALQPRAAQKLLDLHLEASVERVRVAFLGPTGAELATLGVAGAGMGLWIRSDTSYKAELRVFSVTLDDADAASANVHRALICPADPNAELLSVVYGEGASGDGSAAAAFTGVKVVLSADPIFTIAAQVLDAFSFVAPPPGDEEERPEGRVCPAEPAPDAFSWWGQSKVQGKLSVGLCELTLLQDCAAADTPRITLVLCAVADYVADKKEEVINLTVHDVEFFAALPDFPEPLHMLDRSSCALEVRNVYADGRCETDVQVVCRSLDFVVTYQDVKLVYNIVRACQRSGDRVGLMQTAGAKHLEEIFAEEESEVDRSVPFRDGVGPTLATRVRLTCDFVTVCLINDCMGWTVPFATASLKSVAMEGEWRQDFSSALSATAALEANFYNIVNTCFEPVLEPWTVKVEYAEEAWRRSSSTRVHSDQRLDVNICEMHMRGLVQTMESWMQDSKSWGSQASKDGAKFWPYRLRNEAGAPLTFWLGSSLQPPDGAGGGGEQPMVKQLDAGGEEPFAFSHKRALQARQRDMSLEIHTLSIRFEGVPDVLTHVPVDIIGVHMLPLGELRAVAEIHSDSGTKIVAIQSTFKVYNKSSFPVEASVYQDADAPCAWSESFEGDMHGCVPLSLVGCKYMRLRPSENAESYAHSDPIAIPEEPVTGESVFVRCTPLPGAPPNAAPVYFRVRLDAKKPIGGHEERMRVVISIHPALRVQNLLPYAMQVSVHAGGGRGAPELIASITPTEGSVEQLHCSDLTAPLHLTAFMAHFRKSKLPVLVYHPDGGVATAKSLELLDEQGVPLHLGVDTTTSAWGDLTVVFYAQYLLLNFSSLPLTYGVHKVGRAVQACAGQGPSASPESSPAKMPDTEEHTDAAHVALHGIYAVFGPRSRFRGRLVACKPPMADSDITNVEELRGNVALIERGVVPFTLKARRAAAAGAVGIVFINSDDSTFLAEGDSGPGIRLPCVMLTKTDGQVLRKPDVEGFTVAVTPETRTTKQRASSQHLEWKRVVQATVHVHGGAASAISASPNPALKVDAAKDKDIEFPDSWMELPGDPPFMMSYDSHDLTGNRSSLCVRGSDWSEPFSLESMGTTGVLQAKGLPSDNPSLKKARPLYELGLSFQLGTGNFSRSKVVSIVPRYTVVNRTGHTLQISQSGLEGDANAHLELPDGELQAYHWIDERRPKTCTARVVPRIGTHETFHTGWCGPLKLEQVGTFAVLFPAESEKAERLHVTVEVRLRKAASFIIFRKADPERPMYAVENRSSRPVMVWQEKGTARDNGVLVLPGVRVPYSWDRPHDARVLMLCTEGSREVQPARMEKFAKFKCRGGLNAEILADGSTRTLRVLDGGNKAGDDMSVAGSDVGDSTLSTVTWEFAGAGVSLVDSKLEEILFACALDVNVSFRKTRTDHEFELKVGIVQVDNQTDKGPEIILSPDAEKSADRPTVHVSIVKSRLHKHMGFYKYFAIGVREMVLDLEETFVMLLLDTAQNVVDASTISPPEEKSEDIRNSGFKKLRFLAKEPVKGDKLYVELLQLHPILVTLSFFGTGAIMTRASSEGGGLSYNPMFAAMKALGVVVTNIDKAPIQLNALVIERPFATQHELFSSVRKHYKNQLVHQLYALIGSFEFLGNPVGLVNNLGTGVHDFFYEPAQGITKSPAEFAKGMSKGSLSLWRNSVYGVFNAASKITGSMSKGLVQLSGDEEYIKKRQDAQAARLKNAGNMDGHRKDFANELSEGFAGIFAKPMAGYSEGGAAGFMSGLGKGLLGAVVKPTAGLMDLTSKSAEAARDTAKSGKRTQRVRPPRVSQGDGVLRMYDARSAHGLDAMRRLRDGKWVTDRYIGFSVLEKGQALVVTDKHVCVHDHSSVAEKWTCPIKELASVRAEGRALVLQSQPGKGRLQQFGIECPDERMAEYVEETIKRAVTLSQSEGGRTRGSRDIGRSSEYML